MAVTSYEPGASGCEDQGRGFLYILDSWTGLPRPDTYDYFAGGAGRPPASSPGPAPPGEVPGGLFLGGGIPSEAAVSVTSEGVTIGASAPDGRVGSIMIPSGGALESGVVSWREVGDFGFELSPEAMSKGLT